VGQWIVNSLVIAAIGTAITVVVALLAGYAFAKFEFRGRNLLFGAFLVTIVIPAQVTLVPSFLVVVNLRLVDTTWAVILPRAADAIAIFRLEPARPPALIRASADRHEIDSHEGDA